MDIELCEEATRRSFKYKETLYESLLVSCDVQTRFLVFWNKYQIFIHDNQNCSYPAKILVPEFQIYQVLVAKNVLVCVDCSGNVHTISLKFKNSAQKRIKTSFQPKENGVLKCILSSLESAVVLKYDFEAYFLCWHKLNTDFSLERKVVLIINNIDWPPTKCEQENCILNLRDVTKEETLALKSIFNDTNIEEKDNVLVMISFDKLTLYAGLFSPRGVEDTISLVKLYTSPAEICDIKIIDDFSVLLALVCGTLVRLSLKDREKSVEIIHLNTAIKRLEIIEKDHLIYTDGLTMWKASNVFSKTDLKFNQFFVKDVKDFLINKDHFICTTYTNIIYMFPVSEGITSVNDTNKYTSAEKFLNNSDCLYKILEEVNKNKEIIEQIDKEGNYLTAVTLSRKQEIMNKLIDEEVLIFEKYEDVLKDYSNIVLIESLDKYFETDVTLFLVKLKASIIQHALSHILIELLRNINIHITIVSFSNAVLKTASIKMNETLKEVNMLIPLTGMKLSKCKVEIKLMLNIPGALDKSSEEYIVLYRKTVEVHVEHFVKFETTPRVTNLVDTRRNIEELIKETAEKHHGDLFEFIDITKPKHSDKLMKYYVKLPDNFEQILHSKENYKVAPQKANYLQKNLTNDEFLKCKTALLIQVDSEKVKLAIQKDEFCSPVMRISSENFNIGLDVRNFFANLFYKNFADCSPGQEFISNALYTTIENLQKAPNNCTTPDEYLILAEKFHKNVVGSLPL